MKRTLLLLTLCCAVFSFAQHSFLKDPKLSPEDVQTLKPANGADIPAEVLYRSVHYFVDMEGVITQKYIERVKIYAKEKAESLFSKEIPVVSGTVRQSLLGLKATTYNYENGKVVPVKMEKDSRFRSSENKEVNITKFTFPNIQNGSVLEYEYTISSPPDFLMSVPKFTVDDEVPVRYVEYVFDVPEVLSYNIQYQGDLAPTYRDTGLKHIYGENYNVYRYGFENVPAFKTEKFVINSNNLRTQIRSELHSTNFNNVLKSYASNWQSIRERLMNHENFGTEYKRRNLVKNILSDDLKNKVPVQDRAAEILKFVQQNYTWNKEYGILTDKGIRNLINTKTGNVAEINLLLTMLMREANIDASPVILPTIDRGKLMSYSPSIMVPNYVITSANVGNQLYLYDGTSKYSSANIIPPRALNYNGIVLEDKDAKVLNIVVPERSQTFLSVDAKMNPDGTFAGTFSDRDTNLYSLIVHEAYDRNNDEFVKSYRDKYKFNLSNIQSGSQENGDFETTLNFTSDIFVDQVGSKRVFNPLLFLFTREHDFNQKEPRRSPLEFLAANEKVKKVTITLPEGYVFENIPTSKKFRTDDSGIVYNYIVKKLADNKLEVETSVLIDDAEFPKEFYPAFTQIFDNITKLEGQVVTAVKK